MFVGTKPTADLEAGAPTMPGFDAEPVTLAGATVYVGVFETPAAVKESVLPPGLHPTTPPIASVVVTDARQSPWGPFRMAEVRVGCRSGARPRAFLVGAVVDSPEAAAALGAGWGYRTHAGSVGLDRGYDRVRVEVTAADRTVLAVEATDPVVLRPGDVQWIANMHLARTPRGLRLVQVDPDYEVRGAERFESRVERFDAPAWGEPELELAYPVASAVAAADVHLPRIRYLCSPDESAFVSTEVLPDPEHTGAAPS